MDFSLLSLVTYLLLHHAFCSVIIECFHSRGSDVASTYANLLEQKKAFAKGKNSTPTGLSWYTKMAAVSLFWNTNIAAVTSCENALYILM